MTITLFQVPAGLLLNITVPVIDKAEDNDNWNRWLAIIQCVTAPVFISLTTKCNHLSFLIIIFLIFNLFLSLFPLFSLSCLILNLLFFSLSLLQWVS